MLFIVIAAVLIAFSYEPPADGGWLVSWPVALAGALACVVANWLLAEAFAWLTVRRLRSAVENSGRVLRHHQWLRWLQTAVLLASYVGVVHGLDWPGVIRLTWGLEWWVLVDDLLVLLPFAASLLLVWLAYFRVDELLRARMESAVVHPPRWQSRWYHLDFHLRQHLGVVLGPLLVMMTIRDLVSLAFRDTSIQSGAELAGEVVGLVAILTLAPVFLRVLWRAEPLPAGPLRERLERLAARLKFRPSEILIWNTRGAVINAAVAGILPWPRYVLLSDGLLNHMTEDEIEAVFGHEGGRVRHHHLWYFIAFLLGATSFLILSMSGAVRLVTELMGDAAAEQVKSLAKGLVLPSVCLAAYFGIFFGFLSRRFERQADIFGCRAVSCARADCPTNHHPHEPAPANLPLCPAGIQVFVQALEKIATLNGAMRDARSWRHFSIAKRVEFLQQLAHQPELDRKFQRVVLLLKLLVIVALAGGAWYVWYFSSDVAGDALRW
jgi:STE24 endopeptidase